MRKIWKEYFKDVYNIDTQEWVAARKWGFNGIRRGNYFVGEPVGRAEVEMRVGKLKNGKDAGKDEITEEMIKSGGDRFVDWIWRLFNMAFEISIVPEVWKSAVTVLLFRGERERTECKNYRGISLLILSLYVTYLRCH